MLKIFYLIVGEMVMPSLGDNKIEILLSATGSSQRDSVEVRRETEILIKLDFFSVAGGKALFQRF